jgi:hypothetical protein
MRNDLIFDFETMGQDVNDCAVIDVSAMVFNWDKMTSSDPYTLSDISKCRKFKLNVKEQTLLLRLLIFLLRISLNSLPISLLILQRLNIGGQDQIRLIQSFLHDYTLLKVNNNTWILTSSSIP